MAACTHPDCQPPRYLLTRMKTDPAVARRYRRSGWMAFDTQHQAHGQVWALKADAVTDVIRLNRRHAATATGA